MKFPVLIPNIFDHPFTYTSDINLNSYKHLAIYNKQKKRIEMRLKSKKRNNIRINGSNYLIKKMKRYIQRILINIRLNPSKT